MNIIKRVVVGAVAVIGLVGTSVPVHAEDPPIPAEWDGGVCPDGIKASILIGNYNANTNTIPSITYGLGNALLAEPLNVQIVEYEPGLPVVEVHGTTYQGPLVHTKIVATFTRYVDGLTEGQYLESVGWSINGGRLNVWAPAYGGAVRQVSLCVKFGTATGIPDE